ncbi:MAG: hypothetical protein NZL91_05925 [Thermoflexales bacterium]|nr:hypothetical protein [Thermoflexales bacterium]
MRLRLAKRGLSGIVAATLSALAFIAPAQAQSFFLYLPIVARSPECPTTSNATYDLIGIVGGYYKDNRLTDENPDFRLSILGYAPVNEPLQLVEYGGSTDPNAPRFSGIFEPNRLPAFVRAYRRYDWNWNESGPPPYGARGDVNNDWPVSALDLAATPGEGIYIPERNVSNNPIGTVAMVLYADEDEVTLAYTANDSVVHGYVVYLMNFCVDPNLVALYRAQLNNGRRATGQLPAVRNNQRIGTARHGYVTVAIRDTGMFMDPRSRKDWWSEYSSAPAIVIPREHRTQGGEAATR